MNGGLKCTAKQINDELQFFKCQEKTVTVCKESTAAESGKDIVIDFLR